MKTAGTIVIAMVLLASMAFGQSQSKEQQVLAAERALFDGLKNQDAKALSALLAEDFQFRNAGDEIIGKAAFLKSATSVEGTIMSVSSDNMRVQMHGDIAVLSGTQKAVVKLKDGHQVTGVGIFTDVFAFRNDRWLLVFAHNIDLPDQTEHEAK
jgi:ketosteroid isomerase-like protein